MKTLTTIAIVLVLFTFYAFYVSTENCESKGGTYIARANICIKSDSLLN